MRVVPKPEALLLLEQFRSGFTRDACLPCELVARARAESTALAENEHAVVLLNRFAQRRGHLMVWLKRHQEHVHELAWPVYQAMHQLGYEACRALHGALQPVRVYSAVLGSTAVIGNSYAHLHIHVIPVFERDDRARPARVFSWSEGIVIYEDGEAAALRDTLRAHWETERP
jgi:diadenosine tetraphosphate (Ap4A) HIT family hydrolase